VHLLDLLLAIPPLHRVNKACRHKDSNKPPLHKGINQALPLNKDISQDLPLNKGSNKVLLRKDNKDPIPKDTSKLPLLKAFSKDLPLNKDSNKALHHHKATNKDKPINKDLPRVIPRGTNKALLPLRVPPSPLQGTNMLPLRKTRDFLLQDTNSQGNLLKGFHRGPRLLKVVRECLHQVTLRDKHSHKARDLRDHHKGQRRVHHSKAIPRKLATLECKVPKW